MVQGFHLSRPLSAADITERFKSQNDTRGVAAHGGLRLATR
jgi:hypothetical protein